MKLRVGERFVNIGESTQKEKAVANATAFFMLRFHTSKVRLKLQYANEGTLASMVSIPLRFD